MIITRQKTAEKMKELTEPFDKIFIVGCGTCATSCKSGGEEQVAEFSKILGDKVVGSTMIEEPCDIRIVRRDLKGFRDAIKRADAVLVKACGTGVQTIGEYTGKVVLPALDTLFIGETERIGSYRDMCRACGDCILDETGGICPVTRCPKGLLNGPCGGQVDGKCEVGNYLNDCAWILIYDRLKKQDRLDLFTRFRLPRDHNKKTETTEYKF